MLRVEGSSLCSQTSDSSSYDKNESSPVCSHPSLPNIDVKIKNNLRIQIDGKIENEFESHTKKNKNAIVVSPIKTFSKSTSFDPRYKTETPSIQILNVSNVIPNDQIAKKNKNFNRYNNVLPEDHCIYAPTSYWNQDNKIELKPYYLNAVKIPFVFGEKEISYIATQAPMEITFNEFWKAIVVGKSDTIVNLAMLIEKNYIKCDDYWSHKYWKEQQTFTVMDGDTELGIITKNCDVEDEVIGHSKFNEKERVVKRTFHFTSADKSEIRTITQLHYEQWPDFGVPDDMELFEKLLNVVDQTGFKNGPPFIHCSAGIGRTGTLIVTHALMKQIEDQIKNELTPNVDPIQLITKFREYRAGLVQSQDQLHMIYLALIRFGETLNMHTSL